MLESLIFDIQNFTLLLCKKWEDREPLNLKCIVIKSVNINTGTMGQLMKVLRLCSDLQTLELVPSAGSTADNNCITPTASDPASYTWNKLSNGLEKNNKLKSLKLHNLILVGEVDTLLSHLNRYQNIQSVNLGNARNIIQQHSSELHLHPTKRKRNEYNTKCKIELTHLELEQLYIIHSPINFIFDTTKKYY
ncbi:hypothetical protein ACJMK2_042296 [Sinanodonta woodiana]|uniref:Uncharacterized protein n=1 Tax=Sinanodonta woodiana TaxID=1069815 RepID=A0ABD3W6V5_SINWO